MLPLCVSRLTTVEFMLWVAIVFLEKMSNLNEMKVKEPSNITNLYKLYVHKFPLQFSFISIKNTKSNSTKIIKNHKHRMEEIQRKAKSWYLLRPLKKNKNKSRQYKTRQDDTRQVRKPDIRKTYKEEQCTKRKNHVYLWKIPYCKKVFVICNEDIGVYYR